MRPDQQKALRPEVGRLEGQQPMTAILQTRKRGKGVRNHEDSQSVWPGDTQDVLEKVLQRPVITDGPEAINQVVGPGKSAQLEVQILGIKDTVVPGLVVLEHRAQTGDVPAEGLVVLGSQQNSRPPRAISLVQVVL